MAEPPSTERALAASSPSTVEPPIESAASVERSDHAERSAHADGSASAEPDASVARAPAHRAAAHRRSPWPTRLAIIVILAFGAGVASELAGRRGAFLALAAGGTALLISRFMLPSSAHAAFARGDLPSASRRYRVVALTAWRIERRLHAELSLAAIALARADYPRAEALLDAFDPDALDLSARAAWLNNRAYALLRQGTRLDEAWKLSRAAMELRPDVPGIRHTHGLALLLRGQTDAAIAALDELHRMGDLPASLEAERCADLARAWTDKGEPDYAAEYRGRAVLARRRGAV